MIKYEIEKNNLRLVTTFTIKDKDAQTLFNAEEKGFLFNKSLVFYDSNKNEIGKLVNVNLLKAIYELYIEKKLVASIFKPSFKKGYKISLPASIAYDAEPQSMTVNYKIFLDETQKAKFFQTHYIAPAIYEVHIEDDQDQRLLLFSIIAVLKLAQN